MVDFLAQKYCLHRILDRSCLFTLMLYTCQNLGRSSFIVRIKIRRWICNFVFSVTHFFLDNDNLCLYYIFPYFSGMIESFRFSEKLGRFDSTLVLYINYFCERFVSIRIFFPTSSAVLNIWGEKVNCPKNWKMIFFLQLSDIHFEWKN